MITTTSIFLAKLEERRTTLRQKCMTTGGLEGHGYFLHRPQQSQFGVKFNLVMFYIKQHKC